MENNKQIEVKLKRGVKYFTVSQIIKEASRIFCFDEPTNKASPLYIALKREIGRKLKGVKSHGETPRNKKYSRDDVQHLLQVDLYNYFIKKSEKLNRDKERFLEKIECPTDEPQKNMKLVADSKSARETVVERYRQEYKRELDAQLAHFIGERDGTQTEEDKELLTKIKIEKKRREIFFEFLYQYFFDSLIEFDETRFREDLKYELIDDDLPGKNDVDTAEATYRLRDNRNYYELKKSSEEIKNFLDKFNAGERPE